MEKFKTYLSLASIILLTFVLTVFISWYIALIVSFTLVVFVPPFISQYFQTRKLNNLPGINEMPDLILNRDDVTDWERDFCLDMNRKFADKEFIDNISRKQCRKLLEVYLERVRNIPERHVDISKIKITLGGRTIQ